MTTSIAEYSRTEAALADLRERYGKTTYDVTVASGMKAAKDARMVLRTWRTDLEKDRKRVKADALAHCQRVDAEARRITTELSALEDPIDELIKKEEGRKDAERRAAEELAAKAEAERVAMALAAIDAIRETVHMMTGKPAAVIAGKLAEVEAIHTGGYALPEEAKAAKKEALEKLNTMWLAATEQEAERVRLAEEREKLAAERAAMAVERERIAKELQEQARIDAQAKAELAAERAKIEAEQAMLVAVRSEREDREAQTLAEIERAEQEKSGNEAKALAVANVEGTTTNEDYFFVEDSDDEYETLIGPGGFRCVLTEPEDRSFFRDLGAVVEKLNEQLVRIRELEAKTLVLAGVQC